MKKGQPANRVPNSGNPIAHVVFEARDLSGIEGGGGGNTEFVPVTQELRQKLTEDLREVVQIVALETNQYPEIPSVLVVNLRENAIAKSHRPLEMIYEAGMSTAGHGTANEMLVSASLDGLAELERVVNERNILKIRANLSTVEKFEAWGLNKRLPKYLRGIDVAQIFNLLELMGDRLFLRLFTHRTKSVSNLIFNSFIDLLKRGQLHFTVLEQKTGGAIILLENKGLSLEVFSKIVNFPGLKYLMPEPQVTTDQLMHADNEEMAPQFSFPSENYPTVAVFDTGVDPGNLQINPWVVGRDIYVLPPDTNFVHGTQVSSLLINAHGLNANHTQIPNLPCNIYDVCALESSGSGIGDLIIRLRAALAKNNKIKVWNLSLGGAEISDDEFSEFGKELDQLSDAYNVLFVVAAGNYIGEPRRGWPVGAGLFPDRISEPGDSIRAITIGSIAHLEDENSLVKIGEPAPYSRRGPGPVFTPKPDIVHLGGNADGSLKSKAIGINVMIPDGTLVCSCGTSFAAPIAAALAAHTWQSLDIPNRNIPLVVTPSMVKALLVHSAAISSPERDSNERRYYGSGLPVDPMSVLFDSESSFTAMFEVDLADGVKWRKSPFPIPPSLIIDGKLSCEIIITAAYAPPIDSSAGTEYVRVNVDVGFGFLQTTDDGKVKFTGQVPADGEIGTTGFEQAQIEYGGKWSPIKIYRRSMPKGVKADNWALQATMLRRANEPTLATPLRVNIIITLRSLNDNPNVYNEGQRLLAATNWITQKLPIGVPVKI
ncbi:MULTISPECIES: S8 family anti-phage peptidase IteS [Methylotenera]|uniref:S8 family anti-phage peptidase IteS n=1 Tax=Methylotenera TaxID=359407 RepID=UPI0003681CC9|nr:MULTISPECIES: S8 family anti-phage peptidase IteS [Methylotenera]